FSTANTIQGVRVLDYCKTETGTASELKPTYRYSGTDLDGTAVAVPGNTALLASEYRTTNLSNGAWSNTIINGLEVGYNKSISSGGLWCTALMAYADIQTPSPEPDWTLMDVPRCKSGADKYKPCRSSANCAGGAACAPDLHLAAIIGCDS